jgi:hypothetical protein
MTDVRLAALAAFAILATTHPAAAEPLTKAEKTAIRTVTKKWVRAARKGDGATLAALSASPLEVTQKRVWTGTCRKLAKAPIGADQMDAFARCLRDSFEALDGGVSLKSIKRTADGIVAKWEFYIQCEDPPPSWIRLDLVPAGDSWSVRSVNIWHPDCSNDP